MTAIKRVDACLTFSQNARTVYITKFKEFRMFFEFTNTVDEDDFVYVRASSEEGARRVFESKIGHVPRHLLIVRRVSSVPEGEDCLEEE